MKTLEWNSDIRCSNCHRTWRMELTLESPILRQQCPHCRKINRVAKGDCCLACSQGDTACLRAQGVVVVDVPERNPRKMRMSWAAGIGATALTLLAIGAIAG